MAVRSLNKVMLIGNLTRDPNLRYTPNNTAVCSFGLATNRSWSNDDGSLEERTDFHNIVSWAKLAEICNQILQKGDKVYLEGRIQTRDWKTDDGQDRRITEIVLDSMIKLSPPKGDYNAEDLTPPEEEGSEPQTASKKKKEDKDDSKEEEINVDEIADDIPF
ncbi:MAG: Single-stranded DNA-binding protein [Microgenomates bacterium 39_7]|nr:MAG: Single-stranded DNA-binding protein [Microgenomates bacterium 39_7]